MSLELCVLGSGSGGNSTVVRSPAGNILIDAGFGPRVTEQRLHGLSLRLQDLTAIVLTHLDHDHFNPNWLRTLLKFNIRVYCAQSRVKDILHSPDARDLDFKLTARNHTGPRLADLVTGFENSFTPVRNVHFSPLHFAHDETGSHGFLIECHGYRVGFATDLGRVPDTLIDAFCGVDVLALESNYDHDMELSSERPFYLKQRIMGGRGHLSNDQAFAAIQTILDQTATRCGPDRLPRHIVLLHRSRECNCPKLLKKLFTQDPRISPVLTLTHQNERTPWLCAGRPRTQAATQLAFAYA